MSFAFAPPTPRVRGRRIPRAALAASLIAGMGVVGVATGPAAQAAPNPSCLSFDSLTQSTTTGVMYCDVPAGVTALDVIATGAGGGGGGGVSTASTGGAGAVLTTQISVTPGETLTLEVGTGGTSLGASQPYGGGGGGWSAVKRATTAVAIAGGGGGGGGLDSGGYPPASLVMEGGNGGTPVGVGGSPTTNVAHPGDNARAGGGGTASAGGTAGPGSGRAGNAGVLGAGGQAGAAGGAGGSTGGTGWQGGVAQTGLSGGGAATGGGGGAGYYGGGGGGNAYYEGAPGGGGSSYVAAGSATYALASNAGASRANGGAGRIQLAGVPPTASAIAPSSGVTTGGTSVTVTGTNFGGGSTVTIGGQACTSPTVVSPTSLTCTAPAGAVGTADVVVTSSGQSATLANGFTYVLGVPGAPTSVVATAGTSSITVTWVAPSSGGTITRYEVRTAQGQAICTTTTLSCVLGAEAGVAYGVTVVAVGPAGTGAPGQATSGVVASPVVPSAVPTNAPVTLTTDKGQITTAAPGQDIVVIGTGFAPFSTATIVIYSTPTVLGTVLTDANGNFSKPVTVPASLAAGMHNLVASGVDPQGATRTLRMEVTVAAGGAGNSGGSGGAGASSLASTGFSGGVPLLLGGLLLTGGAGLAWAGRRKAGRVGA